MFVLYKVSRLSLALEVRQLLEVQPPAPSNQPSMTANIQLLFNLLSRLYLLHLQAGYTLVNTGSSVALDPCCVRESSALVVHGSTAIYIT